MLETLRAWLNGKREYYTGVALYGKINGNDSLYKLLCKGKSTFSEKRLQDELWNKCQELKARGVDPRVITTENSVPAAPEALPTDIPPNPDLYQACLKEADFLYKELMNERALLFASTKTKGLDDVNRPELIQLRSSSAISIVIKYRKVSQLYDRARYVKINGTLPAEEIHHETSEYDSLPDHLVKQTLDNLRKNYNKLKNRPQTADRIALVQKHLSNIEKLEKRWQSLKPVK